MQHGVSDRCWTDRKPVCYLVHLSGSNADYGTGESLLADLAEALDVSDSAVSVRVRIGVSAVLEQTIDADAIPDSVE
ncbi:hypothetical protein [Halorientalis halophila]|uniref:hypothetical protein n=1 Tax=Halorientalis halophila TaxID=3108499 RepID=UPI00300A6C3F